MTSLPWRRAARSLPPRRAAATLLATLLAPAAMAAPAAGGEPKRPQPPAPPVTFVCADGARIVARFPDASIAMLTVGEDRYELKAAVSGSGARYEGGGVEFWEHHGVARFTRDGKETECRPLDAPGAGAAEGGSAPAPKPAGK
ncbi:MliC family protein [Camelimonas abortus]|uniref:MliC family protein n=1 Tax=Camelimonas abortus TaxID=1017184 RepID=A0ABV7LB57_9HYPH